MSTEKEKKSHLGVEISDDVNARLNLFSAALDVSKSVLVRAAINEWIADFGKTDHEVMEQIMDRLQTEWNKQRDKMMIDSSGFDVSTHFEAFLTSREKDLVNKNIHSDIIAAIINSIEK